MSKTKVHHHYFDQPSDSDVSDLQESSEVSQYVLDELSEDVLDLFISELIHEKKLRTTPLLTAILTNVAGIFSEEPTLLELNSPISVIGDIHGQYDDLLRVLQMGGFHFDHEDRSFGLSSEDTRFLFMGDYVDRGYFSVEVVMLLFCLKVKYPNNIFLLRGNHESRDINLIYGFADHCAMVFQNLEMWEIFNKVFDMLPIAAVVDNRALCVHGGLSPKFETIEEIKETSRFFNPLPDGIFDMLWSDPADDVNGYIPSYRGAGYMWGSNATKTFLERNNLELIIRAHELQMTGYCWQHNKKVLTIFSAPNYCYRLGNKAAFLKIKEGFELDIQTYDPL